MRTKSRPTEEVVLPRVRVFTLFPKGEAHYVRKGIGSGSTDYKAPPICNSWPDGFRRKLLCDYVQPSIYLSRRDYKDLCIPYTCKVDGKNVMVHYPTVESRLHSDRLRVLGTSVVNLDTREQILVNHKIEAARFLIVLCFLHSAEIKGIPAPCVTNYTGD